MKKTLMTVLAIAIFVAMFGVVGSAYAMSDTGKGPGNGGGGNGAEILSPYMTEAVASALGLEPTEVEERLAAGETFYDIILSMGYTVEFIPEFLASLQETAAEAATADGLTPQVQIQLNTNSFAQSQLADGTCDGTGDCTQDPVPNLYSGTNSGTRGRRGGR